ncbi:ImmA/IrrE family metallo-endopeptidase [Bifidobacterium biavatii]|nr:ImmA/IrrE family metallo-endopeptidase [Bifidobacterium biavatii]
MLFDPTVGVVAAVKPTYGPAPILDQYGMLADHVPTGWSYGMMRMNIYETPHHPDIRSFDLPGDLAGFYRLDLDLIVIDKSMDYTRKRCTLVHELVHRQHRDDTSRGRCGGQAERQCQAQTARMLIRLDDYIIAEHAYDGDITLMADALNVTTQIVEHYRRYVIPTINRSSLIDLDF